MAKPQFFMNCIKKYVTRQDTNCPYCGSDDTQALQRKKLILQLRLCHACALMFRYPKDDTSENKGFYQKRYKQQTVTELPTNEELPHQIASRFASVGRDITEHWNVMRSIKPHGRLLDYGCSWGYCVHQFREKGYDAVGFEISEMRVDYGRSKLGLELVSNLQNLPDHSFDVIYSAHVLEHIPNPAISFQQFKRLLKPRGTLFIFVPNCASEPARRLGVNWGPMINEKHVLAFTPEFFEKNLRTYGFSLMFASTPYSIAPQPYRKGIVLNGEELLTIASKSADVLECIN